MNSIHNRELTNTEQINKILKTKYCIRLSYNSLHLDGGLCQLVDCYVNTMKILPVTSVHHIWNNYRQKQYRTHTQQIVTGPFSQFWKIFLFVTYKNHKTTIHSFLVATAPLAKAGSVSHVRFVYYLWR